MIKGPEPLDKGSAMYKEWEELCRQIIKRCVRKVQERPQLVVEMLFSKMPSMNVELSMAKKGLLIILIIPSKTPL